MVFSWAVQGVERSRVADAVREARASEARDTSLNESRRENLRAKTGNARIFRQEEDSCPSPKDEGSTGRLREQRIP